MASRKLNSRAGAWFGILALLVFLTALALISGLYLRGRADLTRDRQFTLSPASRKTLENLDDIVTLKVIMSRDLPADFRQRRTEVMDWLQEFKAHSGGKVRLVVEDPGDDAEKRQAAEGLGIQEVSLRSENRESMEVTKGFFGLALLYGDKKEVFPVITGLSTFEYDLVVKLKRLTGSMKTIGIVEGADGARYTVALPGGAQPPMVGFEQNFPTLKAEMDRLFQVIPLYPDYLPIDTAVDLIVVLAPRYLGEMEKFRLDQFLMRGKSVLFLTPGMDVDMAAGFQAQPSNNGYEDLLAHYGMGVRKNMLVEPRDWEQLRFGSAGNAGVQRPYPYWMVENYGTFSPDNAITAKLQTLSFPWASSVEWGVGGQGPVEGARTEVLVRTTPFAWEEGGMLLLTPRDLAEYQPQEPQSFPLVVLRTGPLKSYYAGFRPPGLPPGDSASFQAVSRGEPRLLVIGNALFATDFYVGYTGATGNLVLLLNALNQLALDPDLIQIRGRQITEAPLDPDAAARLKTPLTVMNLLLAPMLIALVGIFAGLRRRRRE
jgi:ABC-type uncharacterized transport system involved in gliding motility auxiliary subunit